MRADYKSSGNNVQLRKALRSIRVRQKPEKGKVSLIDITRENDSLLPSSTTTLPFAKNPQAFEDIPAATVASENDHMRVKEQETSVSGSIVRGQDTQQDIHPTDSIRESSEEMSGAERILKSGKKSRSARAKNNLRKSLAWDKAFSTCEGVLDIDELPFVTKTPRKPLELHPLEIPEILGKVSSSPLSVGKLPLTGAAASSCERITSSPVRGPVLNLNTADLQNSLTTENASVESSSPVVEPSNLVVRGTKNLDFKTSKLDIKASKLDCKPSPSVGGLIKQDVLKGTRLRLPNTFTGKRGKIDPPKPITIPQDNFLRRCKSSSSVLSPSLASAAISNKVSAVSKKVKDTLGKALSGNFGGSARHLKVSEDRLLHEGQGAKTSQTPLGDRADVTREDLNSPGPAAAAKSKSTRGFFSGNSSDTSRKKDAQVETNNQSVNTDRLGNGILVSSSKATSPGKDAASLSKKGTENRSFYSTKVSPMFSRKKSGPAGSKVPRVDNSNHVRAPQSTKGNSSGLRLPSPKMGFFDKQTRSATGEHPSNTLSEKVLGSASDNSSSLNSRKGLPPRPQHGLPSSRAGKPFGDSNLAAVASELASSGIPSAKGLVSAVSAPTSPRKSPGAHKKVVTGRGLASQRNFDHRKTPTLRNDPNAFQNLLPESRDSDSVKPFQLMGPPEVDAQPQVMDKSAVSAPTSPHKSHHGMLSPGAHKKVVTGRGLASERNSDHRKTPTLRNDPNAFQNRLPESRDSDSVKPFQLMGPPEVDAQPQVMDKSAVSAPTSPHKSHHGMLSPGSHKKVVTGRGLASQRIFDHRKPPPLRNDPPAFQNLMPESRDTDSDRKMPFADLVGPPEVDAQPQVMEESYGRSSSGHEADVDFGNLVGDRSPTKLVPSPLIRTRRTIEQPDWCTADSAPLSGSPSAGLMDKNGSGYSLTSMFEDIREASESVSNRKSAGSIRNGSDELIVYSSVDPSDTAGHIFPLGKLDGSAFQDSDRVGSVQSANGLESARCPVGHSETLDIPVGHPVQQKALGPDDGHPRMANFEFERSLSHDSAMEKDREIEDSSMFSQGRNSIMEDISCFLKGELVLEDSAKAITSCTEVLSSQDSTNITWTGERKTMSTTKATEERVQELKSRTPTRHLEKADVTISNDNCLESPSHWSDWPILTPARKISSQSSSLKEHTGTLTPSKGLPYPGSVTAENGQQSTPNRSGQSLSPTTGSDSRGVQNPLTLNVGIMNGISKSLILATKEGNFQLDFDQLAFETTSGQENKRGSDGLIGSPHLRKPKQRKPNSSQNSSQQEAYVDLFSEERLRALEAAGAESLQKKTGAVQHSPPNKITPNRNPWSPVKRSGHQPLGPFDCTKKHSSVLTGK